MEKIKSKEEMVLSNSPVLPLRMPGTGTPYTGHWYSVFQALVLRMPGTGTPYARHW